MVATVLSTMVVAVVMMLTLYSARCFAALGNYADMDGKSRNAVDVVNRELRAATAVTAVQSNLPTRSLTLTNADLGQTLTLTFDSAAGTLSLDKTGQPTLVCLSQCDDWEFALYNRAPTVAGGGIVFNAATSLSDCKIINMSWKCSRQMVRQKVDTENVQTSQVVLRNKIY
jgi:hypothetical protein